MKTKLILVMTFALFTALLALNSLPQGVVHYGATLSYAMGPNPGKTDPNRFRNNRPGPDQPAKPVPEPSTLALMGSGAAGAGIYFFLRYKNRKK